MEAKVIMMRCRENKKAFGARIQKHVGNDWLMTWAFEIDEDIAAKEGFEAKSTIRGSFINDEEYPGCPHCGADSFFICNVCGKLTCWDGTPTVSCSWCGNTGTVELVDELELKGGGF